MPAHPQRPIPHPQKQRLPNTLPGKPVQPDKSASKSRTPWLLIGGIGLVGFTALMCVFSVLVAVLVLNNDKVASGVEVAGVTVGGLSASEAETALAQQLTDRTVTMTDQQRTWQMSYSQLGLTLDLKSTMGDVEDAKSNAKLQPRYNLDLGQAQRALFELSNDVNIDAIAGRDAQNGRAMEIPVSLDRLRADALGELSDGVFELDMIVVEPPEIESLDTYNGERTTYTVQPGQELALIAKEFGVDMDDIVALNNITDANLIYPGQELIIPAAGSFVPENAPAAPLQQGKSIVVDTNAQRIYAYQNGELIHSHLTSTGRAETPTVLGDYNIYVKYEATDMRGPGYYLPDVPYTMYFYQGYGIHGTYWHNSFGRPMSHGCVNLPTEEAKWFFDWAQVGTLVRVI